MQQSTKSSPAPVARVYAHVNARQPREYWDYEGFTPTWHSTENYEVVRRLGRGKYAEVFEAVDVTDNTKCAVKILKPIKKKRIRREVLILQNLRGCANIIQLLATVKDPLSKTCALVTEYVESKDFKILYPTLSDTDIRYYTYQILAGLDEAHSHGIMHRDIKPHNIVIDHSTRTLRIIDWGLAEFYHPQTEYHVRVASRSFKGPELLVNMANYDYSLDMWSFGATLAGMVFLVHPFFYGKDNLDQLTKIAKVCGSQAVRDYLRKYNLSHDRDILNAIGDFPKKSLKTFINQHNQRLVSDEALDLVEKLLVIDHEQRLTAREAMAHPYFDPIREEAQSHLAQQKAAHQSLSGTFSSHNPHLGIPSTITENNSMTDDIPSDTVATTSGARATRSRGHQQTPATGNRRGGNDDDDDDDDDDEDVDGQESEESSDQEE